YQNLILSRERAEALAFDRQPAFQADQARQDELRAKSRYVIAVDNYQRSVDSFKLQLALPLGVEIDLDDSALEDLKKTGLVSVSLEETEGYELAVKNRLDLINEIDRFEDSKRKITVAADGLKTTLNVFANASLNSDNPDYAKFDFNNWRGGVGLQLNLPLDRLSERNIFRTSFINFERQLRSFAIFLDDTRNEIRQDLRTLQQSRQNYDIQTISAELAERRVESATLLLQAGRAQIRDLLEAQSALLQARNAVTALLVDYNVARLALLLDLGLLKTDVDQFWVKEFYVPTRLAAQPTTGVGDEVIPPDKLFGN
ncbi:MAG: TolC family protein, partial [Opitutaceae bacterium]|nr:TolC family protein [Verrucomicrobiales bacterium]